MSDFVQRLIARGAGKVAAASHVLLQPRPLSRFETAVSSSGAEGAEGGDIGVDRMQLPEGSPLPPRASHRTVDTPVELPAPVERLEASTPQSRPDVAMPLTDKSPAVAEASGAHDAAPVARDRSFAGNLAPPERSIARPLDENRLAGPRVTDAAIAERMPTETPTERRGAEFVVTEFVTTEAGSRPLAADDGPPAAAAWPIVAPDEAPAPVSVTIGRIDVQYIQPQPPVAAAPPRVQRTRGFDSYARARRGEPR